MIDISRFVLSYARFSAVQSNENQSTSYHLIEADPVFLKLAGVSFAELSGKDCEGVFGRFHLRMENLFKQVTEIRRPVCIDDFPLFESANLRVCVMPPVYSSYQVLLFDMRAEQLMAAAFEKHKLLVDSAQDIILYLSETGKILDANSAAIQAYGYDPAELGKLTIHDIRHPDMRNNFEEEMLHADSTGVIFHSLHRRKDGSSFPVEVSANSTMIGGEKVRIHIIRDVTERRKNEEKILYLATHDSLTDVYTRAQSLHLMEDAIHRAQRRGYRLALLFFDIDRFKAINDTHGHIAGDTVLKTVALRVKNMLRAEDLIGRFGGDEFIVMLPYESQKEEVISFVNRMLQQMKEPVELGAERLIINVSIGVSLFPEDSTSLDQLIRLADEGMYRAKKNPDKNYSFYS